MSEGIFTGVLAPSSATRSRAVFSGDNGAFRRLVTHGALLELVTFGFYRFWLTTNIRRYLWTHTSAGGDALEYTGTGRELLIGFLFALAIMVPIYLVYFVIGIEAERWQAFASVPFGLLYYGFWQFAVYRARRYRLTRTLWRGVRLWMTGAGTAYALRAFGWTVLTVVTLGLAYPWRAATLERYKMGHTFYGDLPGRFEGKGFQFFLRGSWLWFLGLLSLALSAYIIIGNFTPGKCADRTCAGNLNVIGRLAIVALPFPSLFIYPAFKATEWKWWVQGLRLGGVRFDSDLTRAALIANIWKMIGAVLLVSIAVSIVIVVIGFLMSKLAPGFFFTLSDSGKTTLSPGDFVTGVIIYLAVLLALSVVWRIYMVQRIWKFVVSSISIENLDAAEHVVAKGEAASALGEGLADSLDVAGF